MPSLLRHRPSVIVAVSALLAGAAVGVLSPPANAATPNASSINRCANLSNSSSAGRIRGIAHATSLRSSCGSGASDAANGTPPLIYHGGPVMSTRSTGSLVVTPIFWNPDGHPIARDYKGIINQYLRDVAGASGERSNVFSTLTEYFGTNGRIRYSVRAAAPVSDTNPLPADGCSVAPNDTSEIYVDHSGYDACLDDDQIIAETENVVTARHLPRDYAHIYVTFLPKHVESCFYPGSTLTADNACTINHQPSAAYCAYHSQAPSSMVYANMPFPVYQSPVGFTCGTEKNFGAIQSPNGNPDADVEISPTSHEIMEAVTDPDTVTGWYDSSGYENGDECAYVFGATRGRPGRMFNQVIGDNRYLTQEEFSNINFAQTAGGCLQHT